MTTGLFEVIASTEDPAVPRAVIAAQTRAKTAFDRYLSQGDREARLVQIDDDIRKLAFDVAEEYGIEDHENLYLAATVALGGGHPADCTCGFCENKGSFGKDKDDDDDKSEKSEKSDTDKDDDDKDDFFEKKESSAGDMDGPSENTDGDKTCPNCGGHLQPNVGYDTCPHCSKHISKTACSCPAHDGGECTCGDDCDCEACHKKTSSHKPRISSVLPRVYPGFDWEKTAAGPETGDSYQSEVMDMPSSTTGLGDTGAVPTDKAKSGNEAGWNLKPIDVGSKRNELDHQDITDRADYNATDFDPQNSVIDRIDPDKPLQPEFNVGDNTKTWSDVETQQAPVTSKWKLLG